MATSHEPDNSPSEQEGRHGPLDGVLGDVNAQYHQLEAHVRDVNERIDKAAGRPLWAAILVGLALGGVFLATLLLSSLLFSLFVGVLLALAVIELVGAMRHNGARLSRTLLTVVSLAIVGSAYFFGGDGLFGGLFAGMLLIVVGRLILAVSPAARAGAGRDIQRGFFVLMYLPFLASAAVALRQADEGQWWIFATVITVVSVDTAAYATGRALGKHKLAPAISPGKTWEGLAGATVAGLIAGVATGVWMLGIGPVWGAIIGLAFLISATLGDLAESLIKRELGIKDMSTMLPGHGGVLDRLDSALPSIALAYLIYQFLG